MSKLPAPPPKKRAHYTWKPFALDGIDVRLMKRTGPTHPNVPKIDPDYAFREEMVRELAWAVWPHDEGTPTPCLLAGPTGSGKTSLVMQVAARCNIPVYRINLNIGTTTRHLKGKVGAKNGSTVFIEGVVTRAMEEGAWLLLDELSGATPPVALTLFPILETSPPGEVLLEDSEPQRYIRRSADFRLFGTDNTIGAAQEDNRFNYSGTNPDQNEALLGRFESFIQCDYLDSDAEFEMIMKRVPSSEPIVVEGMVRTANNVRGRGTGEDAPTMAFSTPFSTRMLMTWARRFAAGKVNAKGKITPCDFNDILRCARPAFLNRMRSGVERDAISEMIRRTFEISEGV